MFSKKIQALFDKYIISEVFTLNDLYLNGFNKDEYDYLYSHNIIEVRDNIIIINNNYIHEYVKYLLKNQMNEEQILQCYNTMLKNDPINRFAIFRLFLENIKYENYEDAYDYLNKLFSLSEEPFLNDCNFYLFLLNFIYPIPKKFSNLKTYAIYMKLNDIIYSESCKYNKQFVEKLNYIRQCAFKFRFSYAFNLYNDLTINKSCFRRDFISKILLYRVIEIDRVETNQLLNNLSNYQYYDAYIGLKEIKIKHRLRYTFDQVYNMLNLLFTIITENKIPEFEDNSYNGDNILKNIKNHNYQKAYALLHQQENKTTIMHKLYENILSQLIYVINEINERGTIDYSDPMLQNIILDANKYIQNTDLSTTENDLKLIKNI